MSESLVAKRYALALLELGNEGGDLEKLSEQVSNAAEAFESSSELRNAVENPLVHHASKKAVVAEVADKLGLGPMAKNTLLLLVDRRRLRVLPFIARYLRELSDEKKGIVRAEVTSAAPLADDYYAKLTQKLEALTGKKVVVKRKQDPTLIAGVVTRIGDRVFDGSLRTHLETMRSSLLPN